MQRPDTDCEQKGGEDELKKSSNNVQVRAGSRTYFIDIAQTAHGKSYLRITESRYKGENVKHERASIIVFPEHIKAFARAVIELSDRLE